MISCRDQSGNIHIRTAHFHVLVTELAVNIFERDGDLETLVHSWKSKAAKNADVPSPREQLKTKWNKRGSR
jgi:hypothetical protein